MGQSPGQGFSPQMPPQMHQQVRGKQRRISIFLGAHILNDGQRSKVEHGKELHARAPTTTSATSKRLGLFEILILGVVASAADEHAFLRQRARTA